MSNSNEGKEQLFTELQKIERKGVGLWLEGLPSDSLGIANAIFVNEEDAYMRDYVYEEEVLKELRFDKVNGDGICSYECSSQKSRTV